MPPQPLKKTAYRAATLIALTVVAFSSGYLLKGDPAPQPGKKPVEAAAQVKFWTCSMHPRIHHPGPGQCPICGMDLIPVVGADQHGSSARRLRLSPEAVRLAEIQTTPVTRRIVAAEIRLDGKIAYDETRVSYITAWVPGRIERMFVDYTGIRVTKGDHMVQLYSPALITAQKELLLGLNMLERSSAAMIPGARSNVEAARAKLRLWGLTTDQINTVERTGTVSEQMTIYAPATGIVTEKHGFEGMYLSTGTRIFTIVDLSRLWVLLDAYESDLVWIRYGQDVNFQTTAYPGKTFSGTISFIEPMVNPRTRTVNVRVNVSNPDGRLKPEMLVIGHVFPRMTATGNVMDPILAGKWICPMHPAIVKETPGTCDICGMDLVTAASLGYASVHQQAKPPLVIPHSAPLITGKRAVVYLAVPGEEGVFEGREIVLGPRAGEWYIVQEGLAEGDQVVVHGNFKIDSAIQIQARPSMMNPGGSPARAAHQHGPAMKGDAHGR